MIAAGGLFYSVSTNRFLFLMRSNTKTKGTWGMTGGKVNLTENVIDGLRRELLEELGTHPDILKFIPLDTHTSNDTAFQHHSFILVIGEEFIPVLNNEHCGYAWAALDWHPKPLHPGLWNTLHTKVIAKKIQTIQKNVGLLLR